MQTFFLRTFHNTQLLRIHRIPISWEGKEWKRALEDAHDYICDPSGPACQESFFESLNRILEYHDIDQTECERFIQYCPVITFSKEPPEWDDSSYLAFKAAS